jgi:Uma2 family endonuclease
MPPVALHVLILKIIYAALLKIEQTSGIGFAFSEAPFVLTDTSDWVKGSRLPDVSFYLSERWTAYIQSTPDWHSKPIILVPDLCVEIVSQNDTYLELEAKVDNYLADGVKLIWVVNPRNKTVAVYTRGSDQITRLTIDATLSGGDLLPDFALPVKDIFPE